MVGRIGGAAVKEQGSTDINKALQSCGRHWGVDKEWMVANRRQEPAR